MKTTASLADLLADEFTVICYDRRGNGRSPRPAGWARTSPEEQADDAAALLTALGLAPAAVYGSSPQLPMTEETTAHPEDPYGISKLAVEFDLAR